MSKSKITDLGRGKISYHHRPIKLSIEVNSAKSASVNSDDNRKLSVEDLLTQKHIENESTTFRNNNKIEHRFDIDFKTFNESNGNFVLQSSSNKTTLQFDEKYKLVVQNHLNMVDSLCKDIGSYELSRGNEKDLIDKLNEGNSNLNADFKKIKSDYELALEKYRKLKEKARINSMVSFNDDLKTLIETKKKLEMKRNVLNGDIKATNAEITKTREEVISLTSKSPSPKRKKSINRKAAKILTTNLEIESIEREIMQEKIFALQYECELKDKKIKILRERYFKNPIKTLEEESIIETEFNAFNFEEEFNITYNSNLNTENNEISRDNININVIKSSNNDMREETVKNKKDSNFFDVSLKRFEECKNEQERINQTKKTKEKLGTISGKKETLYNKQKLNNNIKGNKK